MTPRISVRIDSILQIDRQRSDLGDIPALAESLKTFGLIQPIVLNQDLRLIAGGRRLAAAKHAGWTDIDVVFRETMSEDELQGLELEENVRRKEVTWQERCLAIAKIHSLKRNQGSSWGLRETGELLNMSLGNVHALLQVAKALKAGHKLVCSALNLSDAVRVLVAEKEDSLMRELAQRSTQVLVPSPAPAFTVPDPAGLAVPLPTSEVRPLGPRTLQTLAEEAALKVYPQHIINNDNSLNWLQNFVGRPCIDAIVTDPPYAIDMDNLEQAAGGIADIERIRETHDQESNLDLLSQFVPLAFQVLKPAGFLAMWCDPMRFQFLYDLCIAAGFKVQRWPIVWHKTSPCINQCAQYNFTKNIEFCIVARKAGAVLYKPATSCVVTASNAEKLDGHPFTKPPEIWKFLASHICIGNSLIVDPFMGVGSSIAPILDLGHRYMGCEIDTTHYSYALENFKTWHKSKNPKVQFVIE